MPNRSDFISSLGLKYDPFSTPVAEQELRILKDVFYSLYTAPTNDDPSKMRYIQQLRLPQHAFIFGEPGTGKTTIRMTLDADCRTVLDQTLAISYILGEDIEKPLSFEEHGQRLSKTFATALIFNIIERFNPLSPLPSEAQIQTLQRQFNIARRELSRLFDVTIEQPDEQLDPTWGLSKAWSQIGIAPVKYVGNSKQLKEFLIQLKNTQSVDVVPGWKSFHEGLTTAYQWGFSRFLILIDGVDTKQRSSQAMTDHILPLLHKQHEMEINGVYYKFFLSKVLESEIRQYLQIAKQDLLSNVFFDIIQWDEGALRNLLQQRFRAVTTRSGPRYTGLNSLAVTGLDLDTKVIAAARGSPRRLLQVVDMLIDEHVKRASKSTKFDRDDWEKCEQRLATNPFF
jgi:hypothetical protein